MAKIETKIKNTRSQFVTLALLLILLIPLTIVPFVSRFGFFPFGSQSNSYFAKYDYEVANWLNNNSKNAIILSDYFSMKIYQGLSNSPVLFQALNAGEESSDARGCLSFIKQEIFLASSSKNSYDSISSIKSSLNNASWIQWQERNALKSLGVSLDNSNAFVVINPRTCIWLEQQGINDVRDPYQTVNQTYLSIFNNSDFFKQVYSINNQVYIFAPRNFQSWRAIDYPGSVGQNVDDSEVANLAIADLTHNRLIDISEFHNDGAIYGASSEPGKFGDGLLFDGKNDYVNVPISPTLNFSDSLSVEAWVNPSSVGVTSEIVGRASQFMLRLDSSKESGTISFFVVINGSYEPRAKGVVLPVNEWSFVVGTFDGSQVKIYVNGQLVGSAARSGNLDIATNAITIGNVNGNYFNGSISDVRLYNRVLSTDETAEQYQHLYLNQMREAVKSSSTPGLMINIPFTVRNSSESEIKIDVRVSRNDLAVSVLRCEVYDQSDSKLVFSRNLLSTDFCSENILEKISAGVTPSLEPTHQYNMRIYFTGNVNVSIGTVYLLR